MRTTKDMVMNSEGDPRGDGQIHTFKSPRNGERKGMALTHPSVFTIIFMLLISGNQGLLQYSAE